MGKITKDWLLAIALFAIVFSIRVFLLMQSQTLASESYFTLRHAEHIRETGAPLYNDPLSYSGRTFLFPPLFEYGLALSNWMLPLDIGAKVFTSLCISSLVLIVYAISKHLTKSKSISLIAALFTGFVPAIFPSIQSVTPTALSVPLLFLLSYAILRIEEPGFAAMALITGILALLTSTHIFVLLLGLLFYFILLVSDKSKPAIKELEITVFLLFLSIWFYVLLFKKAFFSNGLAVLWGNIPTQLLSSYFEQASFFGIMYAVGVVPLFLGIYAMYNAVFETKNKDAMLHIGFALSSFAFLWLRVLPFDTALLFFSINMIILSACTLKTARTALSKTKLDKLAPFLAILVVLIFASSSAYTFLAFRIEEPQSTEDITALNWVRQNTNSTAVILGRVSEGFLINYFAARKNVADENFLFVKEPEAIYGDIEEIYQLRLSSEAIRLLSKHSVDYIFLSSRTKEEEEITRLFYDDNECFETVYNTTESGPTIYHFKGCSLEE